MRLAVFLLAVFTSSCGGGDTAQCSDAAQSLEAVNAARSEPRQCGTTQYAAASPLVLSDVLTQAAQRHADDLARSGKASHVGSDGSTVADRAAAYRRPVGENVGVGHSDLDHLMRELLASPHHCENVMNPHARHFGAACEVGMRSTWVHVFGV